MTIEEQIEFFRKEANKLTEALFKLADHFGLEFYYECNKPGIMGWWWEDRVNKISGDTRDANGKLIYFSELPEALEDFYKRVGFKGIEDWS